MDAADAKMEAKEKDVKNCQQRIEQLEELVSSLQSDVGRAESCKRDVADEIKIREKKAEMEELQSRKKELEARQKEADVTDIEALQARMRDTRAKVQELGSTVFRAIFLLLFLFFLFVFIPFFFSPQMQMNKTDGMMAMCRQRISQIQKDLTSDQYNKVEKNYRNQLIKLRTLEMAKRDLDKYHAALDKFSFSLNLGGAQ